MMNIYSQKFKIQFSNTHTNGEWDIFKVRWQICASYFDPHQFSTLTGASTKFFAARAFLASSKWEITSKLSSFKSASHKQYCSQLSVQSQRACAPKVICIRNAFVIRTYLHRETEGESNLYAIYVPYSLPRSQSGANYILGRHHTSKPHLIRQTNIVANQHKHQFRQIRVRKTNS